MKRVVLALAALGILSVSSVMAAPVSYQSGVGIEKRYWRFSSVLHLQLHRLLILCLSMM